MLGTGDSALNEGTVPEVEFVKTDAIIFKKNLESNLKDQERILDYGTGVLFQN